MSFMSANWLKQQCVRAFSLLFFVSVSWSVFAQSQQTIPEDLLALDHQRCMLGCVPGFGENTCKPLCDCTVKEFKNKLTFDRYLELSVQLSKNTLTPELRKFLDDTANYCTGELDRMGIAIGEPEPTQN